MCLDRVSNPGPLTYESGALPTALRGPAWTVKNLDRLISDILKYTLCKVVWKEKALG